MVFSSLSFLMYFIPALMICYFCIPQKFRNVRNGVLLIFSLAFYAWGGVKYVPLFVISILINYFGGLAVHLTDRSALDAPASDAQMQDSSAPETPASDFQAQSIPARNLASKIALIITIVLNLALLGWFKYAGFFAGIINSVGVDIPIPQIVLPIGISFYTFQGLSYAIDVYRKDVPCQRNPITVALYIAFFPQLIAGPIVRYKTIEQAIYGRKETVSLVSEGLVRFLIGLGKKMVIANTMGQIADSVYAVDVSNISTSLAWVGAIAYTMQIYFDFSAYSDMAIGLGKVFGFEFEENFNYPYISKSVTEFWRRWHISLSSWFRDYVYIPLGGSYCSVPKHIRNIMVVWFLTGLWHGAAWTFICWGIWFCVFLLCEKYIWSKALEKLPRIFQHIYAMLIVIFSWVLFRAESLPYALNFMKAMCGGSDAGFLQGQAVYYLIEYWPEFLLALIACIPVKRLLQNILEKRDSKICSVVLELGPKILAIILLILAYSKLAAGSFNPFIYFQF